MAEMSPQEAVLRLLELGPDKLLRIEGHGNTVTLRILDGETEHHITLAVLQNDLVPSTGEVSIELTPPADLSQQEARERGLPLYLSRMWLVEQLVKYKSITAVAQETGYPPDLLRAYQKAHGIENPLTEMIRRLWFGGGYPTQTALAEELGVSTATINKAVGNARDQELSRYIRDLLDAGLTNEEIIADLKANGDRRNRDKLLHQINRAKSLPRRKDRA